MQGTVDFVEEKARSNAEVGVDYFQNSTTNWT